MSDTVENVYVEGNFAPVHEEVVAFDLPVTGSVPVELAGRYLRNGPNPIGPGRPPHAPLVHRHGHGPRRAPPRGQGRVVPQPVRPRGRGRRRPGARAAARAPPPAVRRGVAQHQRDRPRRRDVGARRGRHGLPVELDYELESVRYLDFDGAWPGAFSAHPKRDPVTGELHRRRLLLGVGPREVRRRAAGRHDPQGRRGPGARPDHGPRRRHHRLEHRDLRPPGHVPARRASARATRSRTGGIPTTAPVSACCRATATPTTSGGPTSSRATCSTR